MEPSVCILRIVLIVELFVTCVYGDVQIISPKSGESFDLSSGSVQLPVEWMVTDTSPTADDIETYVFTLVSGPNAEIEAMSSLGVVPASELYDFELQFNVLNTVGTDGEYYIQIMAQTDSGYTLHYSPRFTFLGMKGGKVVSSATDTQPPKPETRVTTAEVPLTFNSASFSLQYTLQTGAARFAPMQQQPPKKVSATVWARRHATSAVTYYSTMRKSLEQMTTITPGWSYVLASGMNYATPAPMPVENGAWYDPRGKLSLKPRKINMDRRESAIHDSTD